MSTGEDVTINRKNKTAWSGRWREQGFIIGNTKMSWEDNGGALKRRIIVFRFPRQIVHKDTMMKQRIKNRSIAAILFKCAYAKFDAMMKYGSDDLLGKTSLTSPVTYNNGYILSPSLKKWNDDLQKSLNPLFALVTEGLESSKQRLFYDQRDVDDNQRCYIPLDLLIEAYGDFCKKRFKNMLVMDLTQEIWTGVFQQFNIKAKYDTRPWQGVDSLQTTTFIIGIGSQVEHNQVYSELKRNLLDGTISSHQSMVTSTRETDNSEMLIDLKSFVFKLIDRIGIQRFWSQFNDLANVIGEKLQLDASMFKNMVAYKFAHAEALRHTCIDFRSEHEPQPNLIQNSQPDEADMYSTRITQRVRVRYASGYQGETFGRPIDRIAQTQPEISKPDEADMYASGYQGETFGRPIDRIAQTQPEISKSQFDLSPPLSQLSTLSSDQSQTQSSITSSQPRRRKDRPLPKPQKKRIRIKQELQPKPDMMIVIDNSDSDSD